MVKYLIVFRNILALLLLMSSIDSWSQSVTVIGGDSLATECFQTSQIVAMTGSSSKEDLDKCSNAVSHGKLNLRDLAATYVNRGIIKVALEDFSGGLADYETAIEILPSYAAEAYLNRGNIMLIAKRYNNAIEDYQEALKRDVNQPHVAVLNLGLAYEYLGDLEQAKRYYEEAITVIPEWPTAIEKLSRVNKKIAAPK